MKTKKDMSAHQRSIVRSKLDEVLVARDDGTFEYREGSSDATVAGRAGVSEYQVRKLRAYAYGELKKGGFSVGAPKYGALVDMVKQQGAQIAALEARINAMTAPPMGHAPAVSQPMTLR